LTERSFNEGAARPDGNALHPSVGGGMQTEALEAPE